MKCPILAYHNVDVRSEWGINTVLPELFEKQISFLASEGYKTCSLEDYVSGESVRDRSVILTFDDAYEGVLRFALPIMQRYRMTGTVFVISDYVGRENLWDHNLGGRTFRHLSWHGLHELADAGWEIGSHSATHRDLSGLAQTNLRDELVLSKETLQNRLSIAVHFISYPFDRVNEKVLLEAGNAGYIGGCCMTNRKKLHGTHGKFLIPRRGIYAIDVLPVFKQKLRSDIVSRIFDVNQRVISACSMGSIYYRKLFDR